MNAEDLEREMDARASAKPAPAPPKPRAPLESLIADALELARKAPNDTTQRECDERTPEAERIRDRMPAFVRDAKTGDLERRIRHDALRERARAWRVGGRGMLFVGPTGVGKSSAAALVFRRALGTGWRDGGMAWDFAQGLRWFSAAALSQARREHPLGHGEAPELVRAEYATLLVIDDAGWDRDPLAVSDVLAARYERQKPTIITSGQTVEELERHYGAAVLRRFTEVGGGAATILDCFPRSEP